jgi:magnesium transporter
MTPGPQESPVLSSSPRSIRGSSRSPVRHRAESYGIDHEVDPDHSQPSRTLSRSFNFNAPDLRERQRTMDADMALQLSLSRARRDTVSAMAPSSSPVTARKPSPDGHSPSFPPFSMQSDLDPPFSARSQNDPSMKHEEDYNQEIKSPDERETHISPPHSPHVHLSQGHDPSLLVSISPGQQINVNMDPVETEVDHTMGGLPMYQPNYHQPRPRFDFCAMEDFAREEKIKLGLSSSPVSPHFATSHVQKLPGTEDTSFGPNEQGTSFTLPPKRLRGRKLSASNAINTRRGKMVLFEQSITAGAMSSLGGNARSRNTVDIPPPLPETSLSSLSEHLPTLQVKASNGHDRPYRFSFYSNSLPATIHARSLSELPAEGQTFEDLFSGVNSSPEPRNARGLNSVSTTPGMNGKSDTSDYAFRNSFPGLRDRGGNESDPESATWWLDITSPSDEEMKMLSKVRSFVINIVRLLNTRSIDHHHKLIQVFSIHPLTTEDIQMEETREKIELFRNYYFVCFRSFDQDPYSPTHLEPLNMYVAVFREGTLSASLFHIYSCYLH